MFKTNPLCVVCQKFATRVFVCSVEHTSVVSIDDDVPLPKRMLSEINIFFFLVKKKHNISITRVLDTRNILFFLTKEFLDENTTIRLKCFITRFEWPIFTVLRQRAAAASGSIYNNYLLRACTFRHVLNSSGVPCWKKSNVIRITRIMVFFFF